MKQCINCRQSKVIDDFYRNPNTGDGYNTVCKECNKEYQRQLQRHSPEVRAARKKYFARFNSTPEGKEKIALRRKSYRAKYPDKYRATNAVNNALRDGKIERPDACQLCGNDAHLHAHHHDYDKPLEIVWVCARCHMRHHHALEDHAIEIPREGQS
jgi:protein-arginine kinase activator protein McsA